MKVSELTTKLGQELESVTKTSRDLKAVCAKLGASTAKSRLFGNNIKISLDIKLYFLQSILIGLVLVLEG